MQSRKVLQVNKKADGKELLRVRKVSPKKELRNALVERKTRRRQTCSQEPQRKNAASTLQNKGIKVKNSKFDILV